MRSTRSLLIVAAAVLWSTDTIFRLPLTQSFSAAAVVTVEHLLALGFVVPLLYRYRREVQSLTAGEWAGVAFVGAGASALATLAFTASFSYASPSVAILLQKLQPIATFLLAAWVLHERLPRWFWALSAVALGGAYLVSFPELLPSLSVYRGGSTGPLLALMAAALWGTATVVGRRLLAKLPPDLVTALRFAAALPVLFAVLAFQGNLGELGNLTTADLLRFVAILIGPGFGALFLYYRGLVATPASLATVLELAWPLSAVVINWLVLGQALLPVQLVGGAVLVAAVTCLTLSRLTAARATATQ